MMRRMYLIMTVLFVAAFSLSACGGKEKRGAKQEGSAIGDVQRSTDDVTVKTQRKVTRTITSEQEIPTVRTTLIQGDLNRMSARDFATIGVPRNIAQNIVQWREQNDGFRSVEQLQNVPGMSPPLFNELEEKLAVAK